MAVDRVSLTAPDTLQNVNRNRCLASPDRHTGHANRPLDGSIQGKEVANQNRCRLVDNRAANLIGNRLNLAATIGACRHGMLLRSRRACRMATRCDGSIPKIICRRTMHTTPPRSNCQQCGKDKNQGWLNKSMHGRVFPRTRLCILSILIRKSSSTSSLRTSAIATFHFRKDHETARYLTLLYAVRARNDAERERRF